MKPYIEKNDGVPDNNRYSEALEAAKETVEALNKLTDQDRKSTRLNSSHRT